ncbi:hypothetical protein VOLCADRAFT_104708 [Volvox carteri f. nagariensis]|uniref:Uncharacterized protein n=1 Tax=Volvox carteri f. nagariensis TaxID=3068 RepID=D8TV75_VOLCA|nr:uncharacterized protein VOLCADRAFT_104708 [Volvox carteri f. nagariensis]EFJ48527.1 hypothetical protein VOLCADRAFT_104708 [Volvox carteri f. nagariensis]|eukprot:XP_002950326.1 hypothetical protein VOLCADRAFT_104708 [Volvox carteri f. nagariensis]
MEDTSKGAFPILPSAIQIFTILGALYPHLDIVDDRVIIQTGRPQLEQSLHALGLGSCLLLLGFYCCQFLPPLAPLRKEYLGTLALVQIAHFTLLLGRVAFFPASFRTDSVGTLLGVVAAASVTVLILNDHLAVPARPSAAPLERQRARRAHIAVTLATHTLWLVFTLLFVLPYLSSLVPVDVPREGPYGSVAAVLAPMTALARLGVFVSGRMAAGRVAKQKTA